MEINTKFIDSINNFAEFFLGKVIKLVIGIQQRLLRINPQHWA